VKFLIDECLTTWLVRVANEHGHESHHFAHLNLAGLGDWDITDYAIAHDCVLVTNNAADFRRRLESSAALRPTSSGLASSRPVRYSVRPSQPYELDYRF
jgi:predicted nuclease of predicted toxin-antitoxin system